MLSSIKYFFGKVIFLRKSFLMMQTLYLDILRFLPDGRLDLWGLLFLPASSSSSSLRSDKVSISMLSSPLLNPGLETNLSLSTIAAAKLKKTK